ncbi:MAG TPA: hypothetical protein VFU76_07605 [Terriglobales bacterium]|nr:hypothetical protein [Terriglobales bacterium]
MNRVGIAVVLLALSLPLCAQDSNKGFSLSASKEASAKDIGLPLYPGAKPHKDNNDDSSAVQLGFSGGDAGFRLAVAKFESEDAPDKVAAFYRQALAKYGKVLDCSASAKTANGEQAPKGQLSCGDDWGKPGEFVYKVGTREKQHVVGVQPDGNHSTFQLVYLMQHGVDDKK